MLSELLRGQEGVFRLIEKLFLQMYGHIILLLVPQGFVKSLRWHVPVINDGRGRI